MNVFCILNIARATFAYMRGLAYNYDVQYVVIFITHNCQSLNSCQNSSTRKQMEPKQFGIKRTASYSRRQNGDAEKYPTRQTSVSKSKFCLCITKPTKALKEKAFAS